MSNCKKWSPLEDKSLKIKISSQFSIAWFFLFSDFRKNFFGYFLIWALIWKNCIDNSMIRKNSMEFEVHSTILSHRWHSNTFPILQNNGWVFLDLSKISPSMKIIWWWKKYIFHTQTLDREKRGQEQKKLIQASNLYSHISHFLTGQKSKIKSYQK